MAGVDKAGANPGPTPGPMNPGDEVPTGSSQSGEAVCPECAGTGKVQGAKDCGNCGGTGKIIQLVGDA